MPIENLKRRLVFHRATSALVQVALNLWASRQAPIIVRVCGRATVPALLLACLLTPLAGCGGPTNEEPPKYRLWPVVSEEAVATGEKGEKSAGAEGKRIIVLMNGNSPFWDAVRAGMNQAANEFGVNAVLEGNNGKPEGQISKLRQFGTQSDIGAVAISATDAANAAIVDEMRALQKKGIHVVTIDSDIDRERFRDARFAFIGTDNFAGGQALGKAALALRPDGGKAVQFVGRTGAQNAIERMDGFVDGAGEKFTELDRMGDNNDRTIAREHVRNAIRNHADLNCLVGIWSYNAPAIVDVVRDMGNRDQFAIVVFDAEPLAIERMGEGDIDAMVVQNPFQMGYQGVRLMKALMERDRATVDAILPKYGQPDGDLHDTGLKVVVPNADSPVKEELFSDNTEFFTLEEFRDWLKKYNLTGS